MKKSAQTIVKDVRKSEDGIEYRYILTSKKSSKVASFGMPLYSIEVFMTIDGRKHSYLARDIFSDVGKALIFFDKISENLATPIDLPYILEDMGCKI